ncbi:MAG: hypothetical protein JKY88_16660 [Pseudomonadales bacterium]|nr:hypothetical protein [Pseudomonadales bacterium]
MDVRLLLRGGGIFLALLVTFATNINDNFISRMGLDPNYGFIIVAALLITLFVIDRHEMIIAVVLLFCLNANMPTEFSLNLGFDRDYYTGLMMALLLQPLTSRLMV